MNHHLAIALVVLLALAGTPRFGAAATVFVANDGVDGGGCGGKTAPCRTITQGLAVAGAGDTVLVGPGRYGDLNRDGVFTAPGEEAPDLGNCNCVVAIVKAVKLLSRDGASATIIDAGTSEFDAIRVTANGAQIGKKKKGFTLTGGSSSGNGITIFGSDNVVAGNIATDCPSDGFIVAGSRNTLIGNVTDHCEDGFLVTETTSGNVLRSNRASSTRSAFSIAGAGHTIVDNVADRAAIGFELLGSGHVLRGLVAVGNGVGIAFFDDDLVLTSSVAAGNRGRGLDVTEGATGVVVSKSTIVGNGTASSPNCGLNVRNGASATATGNFWGSASGPGADPADAVCLEGTGSAVTAPHAEKDLKLKVKAGF